MVRANGAVSLRELARVVQTSEVTVRRDVRALEAEGLLDRRHGGAVLPGGFTRESGFPQKSHLASAEKTAIADLAAGLVGEGEAVVVGAGTTTQELARRLARVPGLTVVTNSLLVAQALAHANRVEVVMTGGTLRGSNYALVGSGAEQSLQGLRVSRAFISGTGLTAERGLSTSNMLSASVDRALVQAAAEVVVLADHTKLGSDTMFQTVPTDLITRLVTDEPPPHEERAAAELQALADQGVQISVAGSTSPPPKPRRRRAPPAAGVAPYVATCPCPASAGPSTERHHRADRNCAGPPAPGPWGSNWASAEGWRTCAGGEAVRRVRGPARAAARPPDRVRAGAGAGGVPGPSAGKGVGSGGSRVSPAGCRAGSGRAAGRPVPVRRGWLRRRGRWRW
ncbi:HTH-type transcriptional regulator UlaR [Streptomyces diastaticus subsp. diastaticus]